MNQTQFAKKLAKETHYTEGDLLNRLNTLREAGLLTRGGRGMAAAQVDAREAALILLSAVSGSSAANCPEALKNMPDGFIDTVSDILSDPREADRIEKITFDFINNYGIINRNDGSEDQTFGIQKDFNSGICTFINGSIIRLLSLAITDKESKQARMAWGMEVAKIAVEKGEKEAQKWMEENPFNMDVE
ncbi:MAG: hypothetical protein GX640_01330 [Fibrobacter sp.]|nr:hypothetical protein [Fibrobacter sp.]